MADHLAGMVMAILLVAAVSVSAKDYAVGDASGWTTGVDYSAWAKGKSFNVGDTLSFQFDGVHSVMEVSEADHAACSASSPLLSYKEQAANIVLSRPGTRYFICGTSGHCATGMKLAVTVGSASGGGFVPPAPGARSTKPSDSDSDTDGGTATRAHVVTGLLVVTVGLVALIG